jgi:hypothetical protein
MHSVYADVSNRHYVCADCVSLRILPPGIVFAYVLCVYADILRLRRYERQALSQALCSQENDAQRHVFSPNDGTPAILIFLSRNGQNAVGTAQVKKG